MTQEKSIYNYSFTSIDGESVSMESFRGKKLFFINVASNCGFTEQYIELQELHQLHGEQLVILGFPCDQFGGQEPGTEEQIKGFCQKKYGVEFLMASKIDVKGEQQHPIYRWLTNADLNGVESTNIAWNFTKFLVDEKGNYIESFISRVNPMSEDILKHLEKS
ncbi:MAG: glutathione peroxidase [Crocinitomicaceae bacterium]|nr:glutathione peroxidase [Crocinitomicaceae bacterium]